MKIILYHSSKHKLIRLTPQFGKDRHDAEDSLIVGKKAICLSDSPTEYFYQDDDIYCEYRYLVDVPTNHPLLVLDKNHQEFSHKCGLDSKWYGFFGDMDIFEIQK